jgi:hypothetical protein
MTIELKITFTTIILWLITHFAAHPSTKFSKWGRNKFGDYPSFLGAIAIFYLIPCIITLLYWIWSK